MNFFSALKRILFIGDSITDCGRRTAEHAPLGCGYLNHLHLLSLARQPSRPIEFINRGIGGNTAEDLWSRWTEDVLAEKPDGLVVMIGINDCNRYVTNPQQNEQQSPESYRQYLNDCLKETRNAFPSLPILLAAPFFMGQSNDTRQYRGRVNQKLPEYHKQLTALSEAHGTAYTDTQRAFQSVLSYHPPSVISEDMVHLNALGAVILAEHYYRVLNED